MKKRKMIKGEMFCVCVILLVSLIAFGASLKLFLANPGVSTQGTFPLLTSSIMVLASFVMLGEMKNLSPSFEEGKSSAEKLKETFQELFPDRMVPVILLIVIYAVALAKVGFVISTFVFLFFMMLLLKAGTWVRSLIISAGIVAGIMVIFQFAFHVILP
ncbi:MAG: tripartite tricarboxylate transporter TctB family protein [Enterocloster sp.]